MIFPEAGKQMEREGGGGRRAGERGEESVMDGRHDG
jgi:hypothetical protein